MDDALLAEILAHPDDDAPRLVYADLLTSRGDPRGELITLQCRLAATRDDEGRRKMRIAENKLLAAHGAAWTAPLRDFLKDVDPYAKHEFERGFLVEVRARTEVLERLDALFEVVPTLRRLRVSYMSDRRVPELPLRSPLFARLESLGIDAAGWGDRAGAALRGCPLDGARSLRLRLSALDMGPESGFVDPPELLEFGERGIGELIQSVHLDGLRELEAPWNAIDAAGVRRLAEGRFRLERLELGGPRFDDDALIALASLPSFSGLRHLGLAYSRLSARGVEALASSKLLRGLESLDLEQCGLGGAGVKALFDAMELPSLRHLRLERNQLLDAGAKAIAESEKTLGLRSLELGHNRIGKAGAAALATSKNLANLERLTLNEGNWAKPTQEAFAQSEPLRSCKIYLRGRLMARRK